MPHRPSRPRHPLPDLSPASASRLRSARRLLQRKERERAGRFLAEGPQAVREAISGAAAEALLVDRDALERHADLIEAAVAGGLEVGTVAGAELADLAGTVTPQGILAVCRIPEVDDAALWASRPSLVVIAADIRDPGNAGTLVRCADAFGADAVLLSAGSVHLYNPKTVRASVGSLFHLPVIVGADLASSTLAARDAGLQVLAADGRGDVELSDLETDSTLSRPTAWLFGNEAWGLPGPVVDLADAVVRIPLYGAAESLNLAAAAAVCLYASATAQRRTAKSVAPLVSSFVD